MYYIDIHMYIHADAHAYTHICTYTFPCTYTQTHMHTQTHTHTYIDRCIYAYTVGPSWYHEKEKCKNHSVALERLVTVFNVGDIWWPTV